MNKILLIQVAALGHEFLRRQTGDARVAGLEFRPLSSVFPALTCSVQATLRTGEPPAGHGIVGNGFYSREFARPFFWEQSSALVQGPRIWDEFRRRGHTVGVMFWQQSLGNDADVLLSPAPIHKHHGGMIQDCFSRPTGLYEKLTEKIGRPFNLAHYWGPRAGRKGTEWIAEATAHVMEDPAPDLLLTYLPHLDYELQRNGPESAAAARSFAELQTALEMLIGKADSCGYDVVVLGDYAIENVDRPVKPNLLLREEGLLRIRRIQGMSYPDLYSSPAFAVVDHQIAHVVVRDPAQISTLTPLFENTDGVEKVLGEDEKVNRGIDHPRAGDLVLLAEPGAWFAYPWWENGAEAPDYATHVDIHNKPGYDPCELFWGFWPFRVSTDPTRVAGSHGRTEGAEPATWASDLDFMDTPKSILELARTLRGLLKGGVPT